MAWHARDPVHHREEGAQRLRREILRRDKNPEISSTESGRFALRPDACEQLICHLLRGKPIRRNVLRESSIAMGRATLGGPPILPGPVGIYVRICGTGATTIQPLVNDFDGSHETEVQNER